MREGASTFGLTYPLVHDQPINEIPQVSADDTGRKRSLRHPKCSSLDH